MTPKQLREQILSVWKQCRKDGKTIADLVEALKQLPPEVQNELIPPPPPKPPKP